MMHFNHIASSSLGRLATFLYIATLGAPLVAHHYESRSAEWAIVGAGVAGVSAIGALGDAGVSLSDIIWIDPDFTVGRMGHYYANVPANNKARHFVQFWRMCKTFSLVSSPSIDRLMQADPAKEYPLSYIIEPLQDVTDYVLDRLCAVRGSVTKLEFAHDGWNISCGGKWYRAKRVILAIGAHPRSLAYDCKDEIPLDLALDVKKLSTLVNADDTIAVIGGAHSAVLVMKFLYELGVARIVNFYRSPLYYLSKEDQIARLASGTIQNDPLSGVAAEWAREVLDKNLPANLIRIKTSEGSLKAWLPICNKIIYAAGYERNELPIITGTTYEHDPATGILGPHIFGLGIAFPEFVENGEGIGKYYIGLRDFMRFVQRMLPLWAQKSMLPSYEEYDDLFFIAPL